MRTRAGVVLIEDNKVALIERHRAGLEYFVFPGGGVDEGESPEQAAVREAMEELGVEVVVKQKVAEIQIETSRQFYFLVERVAGEFGTGTGEEFTDPSEGSYVPIWMPIDELSQRGNVYPVELAKLVVKSKTSDWGNEVVVIHE
ncbi:MAG: NUDIX domain-containing protein [Anaerolineales bacterium]